MPCRSLYFPAAPTLSGLARVEYPFHDRDVLVTACGQICMHRKRRSTSPPYSPDNGFGIKGGRRRHLARLLPRLRPRLHRLGAKNAANPRQPVRHEVVTYVLGTNRHLRTEIRPVCSSTNRRPVSSGGATRPTGATRPSHGLDRGVRGDAGLRAWGRRGGRDGLALAAGVAATPADDAGGTTLGDAGPHAATRRGRGRTGRSRIRRVSGRSMDRHGCPRAGVPMMPAALTAQSFRRGGTESAARPDLSQPLPRPRPSAAAPPAQAGLRGARCGARSHAREAPCPRPMPVRCASCVSS